jgi:hypothetical protein
MRLKRRLKRENVRIREENEGREMRIVYTPVECSCNVYSKFKGLIYTHVAS